MALWQLAGCFGQMSRAYRDGLTRRIEGYSWALSATRADELNCWQPEALAIWMAVTRAASWIRISEPFERR